ncbi:MAG: discoidin domain-containing protein [Acidobacteriaceae bacterium]|nr:discoidin domain-containing protein [Acidobacteriaceae bacterium]
MKADIYILFGALFTAATSWALGALLFYRLRVELRRMEDRLLAFVTGSGLLSAIVFVLCCVKLARKGVFLVVGAMAIGSAIRLGLHRSRGEALPAIPRVWRWVIALCFGVFAFLYFTNAMAPEMSPDGAAYHLSFPGYYYRAHGFVRIWWNMYANLTQGIELLFLFAYAFGRHSAAALVEFSYLAALPWLMICYARRVGIAIAGIAGALFFFISPVVGIDGSVAYVDVALAAVLFALFYVLQIWAEEANDRLLIAVGVLAGFAFAIKYTALLALPYALVFMAWKRWRNRRAWWRGAAVVTGVAMLFVAPWLVKNWLWIGDPVTPFANAIFRNPYIHVSFEQEYRSFLRTYTLTSMKQLPWEITVDGYRLCGLFGPLYLLSPLALLALRKPAGRQLLLAAAVFFIPYPSNIGTRFLIPSAPFLSIALALAISWEWVLVGLVMIHAVISWPDVLKLYTSEYAWRLVKAPYREALRIIPEDTFLARNFPGYDYDRAIESHVPPGAKVFAFSQPAEAYTSRQILVKYLAAPNEVLGDIMWTPLYADFQPSVIDDYHFARCPVRKIRVVKTHEMQQAMWNVSEVRLYDQGKELPRERDWRLTAKPNAWDVQLAFDNSPVTRWRTWEPGRPGMYIEIDFGKPRPVDAVRVETQPDWREADMRIEGMDESGKWMTLTDKVVRTDRPVADNMRRAAAQELKARGIRYLLVGNDDIGAEDFQQHAAYWGVHKIAEAGYARLYYIE